MRKKRSDRNHIIYQLSVGRMTYIGVTAKTASTLQKSLQVRWNKHVYRSRSEEKSWRLYEAIRKYGADAFEVRMLEVVRGKADAHRRERELLRKYRPILNTDMRGIRK
jgi:hypothetical protein